MGPDRVPAFLHEFLRFGGIGLLATLTHYGSALLLSRGLGVEPGWAALLGVNASAGVSYFGHGRITFRRSLEHRRMLPRFIVSTLAAYLISFLGSRGLSLYSPLPDYVIYLLVIALIVGFNYLLFRFWVFR